MKKLCTILTILLLLPITPIFANSHGTAYNMAGEYIYDDTEDDYNILYYTRVNAYGNNWVAIGKVRAHSYDNWTLKYVSSGSDFALAPSSFEDPTHEHGNDCISITQYRASVK